MESPVVLDKPPEYHGHSERGFPFDEEEGSGAWSELAARHPDIAARLRQRPASATWARKRRPSSQDATDDFGDNFGGFDRFPFDDIPPEFREHFPSHWNRRYGPRDEPPTQPQASPPAQPPQQQTTATQTEQAPGPSEEQVPLPQYGLRNTVDLGQKSAVDPSLVDADERNQRSMSAPPDNRTPNMSGQQDHQPHGEHGSNVRHIPIFVEGRDEPVINKNVDHSAHFGESKPAYVPPSQTHIDRDQYFADDGPASFHHPPNFSRTFGTPFNKGFRQGPQPFVQQKVYPQTAFARGASPQRSQSPQMHPEEHYAKVPVHHEQAAPKAEPPSRPQQKPAQQPHPPQKQAPPQPQPPRQPTPQREQTPPPPKQPVSNDPIAQILSIQTDVLNLMTDVENFTGTKKDKRYMFLDEMLTRNLIKLDNIETDGKENIRQARKEAIRCIQKCIAVLEAKAEKGSSEARAQDVEMKDNPKNGTDAPEQATENGEVEMNEAPKEELNAEPQVQLEQSVEQVQEKQDEPKQDEKVEVAATDNIEVAQPQAADTRPEEKAPENTTETQDEIKAEETDKKPVKATKIVKKRDKSKENKDKPDDSNKNEKLDDNKEEKLDVMQIDDKGVNKTDSQFMEVDGAASQ